jgi:hypothetical protein
MGDNRKSGGILTWVAAILLARLLTLVTTGWITDSVRDGVPELAIVAGGLVLAALIGVGVVVLVVNRFGGPAT